MNIATLESDLAVLGALPPAQLRARWIAVTGRTVPRVSPDMLRLALAWELQAAVHDGLSGRARQRLDQLGRAKTVTRETQTGMRLMREWQGKLHDVVVGKDHVIRWNEQEWRSLSEVARAITGTRWSGPVFFGLRQKGKAA